MPKKGLRQEEIAGILLEEIPSDDDSCYGCSDNEEEDLQEEHLANVTVSASSDDDDDELPLSCVRNQIPASSSSTTLDHPIAGTSSPSGSQSPSTFDVHLSRTRNRPVSSSPSAQYSPNISMSVLSSTAAVPGTTASTPVIPAIIVVPKWSRTFNTALPGEFREETGLHNDFLTMENPTPLEIFLKFWTPSLIENICFQTNLYAQQVGKNHQPTTVQEIKKFIALNLVMGIKKSPSYRDYWSSSPDLHDPYISRFMTVHRFGWLLSNLHLNDNSLMPARGQLNFDKLYKIRPLLNCLSDTFDRNYKPSPTLAIDESMVKFKGRSTLKQYMPKKPIKRGYKIWMMCAENGYNLKFEIYTGKIGDYAESNLGPRVVLNFCQSIQGRNYTVYFDNYFNCYPLQKQLKDMNIRSCGTVQSTRKYLPKMKDDKNLKRGEYDWYVSDTGISMIKWRDRRAVHLLSNFHNPKDAMHVNRKEKTGEITRVPCPLALNNYNNCMNYVDKFDQKKAVYSINRKSKKWWHRLFFHFLDATIVNSYIVYTELCKLGKADKDNPLRLKDFRRQVYRGLLAEEELKCTKKRGSTSEVVEIKRHKPYVDPEIRLKNSAHRPEHTTSRRCANCSTKDRPIRSNWICCVCKVPLCVKKDKNCFENFHN